MISTARCLYEVWLSYWRTISIYVQYCLPPASWNKALYICIIWIL